MQTLKARAIETYMRLWKANEGQGYVEYLFIIGFVAVAAAVGLGILGTNINAAFNALAGQV